MSKLTLPKQLRKKYRKIVVAEEMYAWKIHLSKPLDYLQGITIIHVKSKRRVGCLIEPRANYLVSFNSEGRNHGGWVLGEKITITPAYIRKLILHAIENGWDYTSDFSIDANKEIPISEHIKFDFPKLKNDEVVVFCFERNEHQTLNLVNKSLNKYIGKESFYHLFSNQKVAEKYMLTKSLANNNLKFWMTKNEDCAIALVEFGKITYFKNE